MRLSSSGKTSWTSSETWVPGSDKPPVSSGRPVASSFRDPSGFVFLRNGVVYRQVNRIYKEHYDHFIASGLYDALVERGLLIPHIEVSVESGDAEAYKVLQPERVPFISYPYEWCFSQWKDAALTTLEVQQTAFDFGMCLKDASAFNIQFVAGRPLLIDTLSFEKYREGTPWIAYRQYCEHFLAPLALMARRDVRLGQLFTNHVDGLPLDLVSRLLPSRTWLRAALLIHVHLHAKSQRKYANKKRGRGAAKISRRGYLGLLDSLKSATLAQNYKLKASDWTEYYADNNYTHEAADHKKALVRDFIGEVKPRTSWDLGANDGTFSRMAGDQGSLTISLDADSASVEANYRRCRRENRGNVLPLCVDLTNPTPALGWAGEERMTLPSRGKPDLVLALALIHHLAIGNNTPLERVAEFLAQIGRHLVVEFVPKEDSQVQRLLASREDVFDRYTQEDFEEVFGRFFSVLRREAIHESVRTLYLMRVK